MAGATNSVIHCNAPEALQHSAQRTATHCNTHTPDAVGCEAGGTQCVEEASGVCVLQCVAVCFAVLA